MDEAVDNAEEALKALGLHLVDGLLLGSFEESEPDIEKVAAAFEDDFENDFRLFVLDTEKPYESGVYVLPANNPSEFFFVSISKMADSL